MQAIADAVQNIYFDGFQICVQSITALKLAERSSQHGRQQSMRKNSHTGERL